MKGFIKIGLALLISSSFAASMKDDNRLSVYIPDRKAGFEFDLSALYLQPSANNLGWSVTTTPLPIISPNWSVNTIKPDFSPGFNLGGHYNFVNPGTDIQLNWSHLNTNDESEVIVNPTSQWVSPFSQVGTPPTQTGNATGVSLLKVAHVKLRFNYDAVNLDLGKFVNFGSNLQTRLFTGLNAAFIKEEISSNFRGLPLPILNFNNTSKYEGIGPRIGMTNYYRFNSSFQLIGRLAGSLLYGKMKPAQYNFTGSSIELILIGANVNNQDILSSSVNQFVPVVDAKLGLAYSYYGKQNAELTFELGYTGAVYFDALSSYEANNNLIAIDSGALSLASAKHTQSNFSAGGPYLSVNLKWDRGQYK